MFPRSHDHDLSLSLYHYLEELQDRQWKQRDFKMLTKKDQNKTIANNAKLKLAAKTKTVNYNQLRK